MSAGRNVTRWLAVATTAAGALVWAVPANGADDGYYWRLDPIAATCGSNGAQEFFGMEGVVQRNIPATGATVVYEFDGFETSVSDVNALTEGFSTSAALPATLVVIVRLRVDGVVTYEQAVSIECATDPAPSTNYPGAVSTSESFFPTADAPVDPTIGGAGVPDGSREGAPAPVTATVRGVTG